MIIELNDKMRAGEISESFTAGFPFLSIVFFKSPHRWGDPSSMKEKISPEKAIAGLGAHNLPGAMEIHAWHTTGAVEQEFGKLFGLNVQVFRKEGAAWIQTANTDSRTLEEQNEAGRNASQELMDGTDTRLVKENPF